MQRVALDLPLQRVQVVEFALPKAHLAPVVATFHPAVAGALVA